MSERELIVEDMAEIVNEEHGKKQRPLRLFTHWLFWLVLYLYTFVTMSVGHSAPAHQLTDDDYAMRGLMVVLVVFLTIYLLPSIFALLRWHPSKWAILVLNLFGGWTVLGWFGALIWSLSATRYRVDVNWDTRFR